MRLIVEVDHCLYPVEEEEMGDREQMAAHACAHVLHCFEAAKMPHSRFFDVEFPDHEKIHFAEIEFGLFQPLPDSFNLADVRWYKS